MISRSNDISRKPQYRVASATCKMRRSADDRPKKSFLRPMEIHATQEDLFCWWYKSLDFELWERPDLMAATVSSPSLTEWKYGDSKRCFASPADVDKVIFTSKLPCLPYHDENTYSK